MIDVRNIFLLNILRMDGQNLTKFCIHIIIDRIYVGKVESFFANLQWSYGPWLMSEIGFCSILGGGGGGGKGSIILNTFYF